MLLSKRSAGRDNNFNLLRMIAASGVLVSHAYPIALGPDAIEPFEVALRGDNLGRACVFVFFAISGFFITRSYAQKEAPWKFLYARMMRLFPGLIVMALITTVLLGLFLTSSAWKEFLFLGAKYFLGVVSFSYISDVSVLPGVFSDNPLPRAINGSLWSLKFEVQCYLAVFVAGLFGLFRHPVWCAILFGLICAAYFVLPSMTGRSDILLLLYVGFPFAVGAAFYIWRDRIRLSWGIALALVALTMLSWFAPILIFRMIFNVTLAYVIFCLGYAETPLLQRYNKFGDYSYGMYIYAFPIQQAVAAAGVTSPLLNILIAFPCTLFCAVLSWHLIEQPSMRLFRGRRSKPEKQPHATHFAGNP